MCGRGLFAVFRCFTSGFSRENKKVTVVKVICVLVKQMKRSKGAEIFDNVFPDVLDDIQVPKYMCIDTTI